MKFAVQMGDSGSVIFHTKFHKDWFSHHKVGVGDTQTDWRRHKPAL
jgi:hypothetical protein